MGIQSVAVLGLMGHGGTRRRESNPQLVSVSCAPAALVGLLPCVTPVGNGASDPLAWCQGKMTESSGSARGLFVKVCSLVRVNFLSIIVSHNVYKTSTLI